ncbi:MAG: hypothetical protein H7070_14215, partial [Saprospiraceae bacterium]|nr:hypothetical protein [Pyrinomonadaceae bacterium]
IGGTALKPMADGSFTLGDRKMKFADGNPATAAINNVDGSVTRLTLVTEWTPIAADLTALAGDWHSEEAQATVKFAVEGDKAFITQRPSTKLPLRPIYKDHFSTPGYVVWVTRDSAGKIDRLHVGGPRMRDMPFTRVAVKP